MSFFGGQDGDLRFAHRHLGVWQTEAAYPWSIAGQFSSLDLDAQGAPWIAFYEPAQLLLRYAHRAPDGWQSGVIQASVLVGYRNSLDLDPQSYPHIAYQAGSQGGILYAYQDAAGWHTETLNDAASCGYRLTSICTGYPHITYVDKARADKRAIPIAT